MTRRLHVVPTPAADATEFFRLASHCMRGEDVFRAALAGGTTPRAAYERIAEMWNGLPMEKFAWERVHFYWGDERMVPVDDARSNYGMARAALIDQVPIPPENVHPIVADPSDPSDASGAAARYESELRATFGIDVGSFPQFDLVFLGMGSDGHTASLFPGAAALEDTSHVAVAARHPESGEPRVTLTLPVLNHAAATLVLVTGREKADRLRQIMGGGARSSGQVPLPVERLNPRTGTLLWIVSRDAAPWAATESSGPGTGSDRAG